MRYETVVRRIQEAHQRGIPVRFSFFDDDEIYRAHIEPRPHPTLPDRLGYRMVYERDGRIINQGGWVGGIEWIAPLPPVKPHKNAL